METIITSTAANNCTTQKCGLQFVKLTPQMVDCCDCHNKGITVDQLESNDVLFACRQCANKFKPGEGYLVQRYDDGVIYITYVAYETSVQLTKDPKTNLVVPVNIESYCRKWKGYSFSKPFERSALEAHSMSCVQNNTHGLLCSSCFNYYTCHYCDLGYTCPGPKFLKVDGCKERGEQRPERNDSILLPSQLAISIEQ